MSKKLSLYKSVKTERRWRYCKAAFHSNAKVKANIVLVGSVEEKRAEGFVPRSFAVKAKPRRFFRSDAV